MTEIKIMTTNEAYRVSAIITLISFLSLIFSVMVPVEFMPRFFIFWFIALTGFFGYYTLRNGIKLMKEGKEI